MTRLSLMHGNHLVVLGALVPLRSRTSNAIALAELIARWRAREGNVAG